MDDDTTKRADMRVLIADPQPVFRLGLTALLGSTHPGWSIAESDTLENHRTQLISGVFNLLIVEGRLLGTEFASNATARGRVNLSGGIVAVTETGDTVEVLGCLAAGAHATISRADTTVRVLTTIETISVRYEQRTVPPAADHQPASTSAAGASEVLNLTNRQLEVLRLLALGQSNKVIARDLGLSVSTVKVHLNTVFRALGARNRVEAVVRARPFQARMFREGQ
jgi:DNA-binding NarL/FixJ family response regulator